MNTPETRLDESDAASTASAPRVRQSRVILYVAIAVLAVPAVLYFISVSSVSRCGGRSPLNACVANLKQIEGAKANWVLEYQRRPQDIPSIADLIGATRYIARLPACPSGGVYTYGRADKLPTCSIAGHSLEEICCGDSGAFVLGTTANCFISLAVPPMGLMAAI